MSHATSPSPRRLTLLTLPPEVQLAICSQIDQWSWTRLQDSLDSSPSKFTYHHILRDRELAAAHLIPDNRKELAMVDTMSRTNRHFHKLLSPYLYSRYGLHALRHCFINGGLETLHKFLEMNSKFTSDDLNQLLIAASALHNDEMAQELVRLGATASMAQAFKPELPPDVQPPEYHVSYGLPSIFQFAANDFNRGLNGSNPLMRAVASDADHEHVKYMLSQGAIMNLSFCDGALPLHEAITSAAEKNVLLLLQYGADPNYRDTRRNWHGISWAPNPTAMEVALFFGTEQTFFNLLGFGATLSNPRASRRARHILEMMALRGTGSKVAAAMFSTGLPLELSKPKQGRTFLHSAAQGGCLQWLDMLVNTFKMDINALTDNKNTPIEWAQGQPDVQQWLLEQGSLPPMREQLDVGDEDEEYEEIAGEWW